MSQRYDAIKQEMLREHDIRVRKWRSSMSGCAYLVRYRDGSESKLIEAPMPKGPMSLAIFLHEVGHHALGVGSISPRCLEEYHAWRWSLEAMEAGGFNITARVHDRMRRSLEYAVDKAVRRGLKRLPAELLPYYNPNIR